MRVGFAGLGRMGVRMAANLVNAGHTVAVWNRTGEKAEAFARDHDAESAPSPAELRARSDVVITMLADDAAVEAVYFGSDGLLTGPGGASVYAEMGTISVQSAARIHEAMADAGLSFVDAPVSGATKAAQDAQLLIMAGAEDKSVPLLDAPFDALGKRTIWLGGPGRGAAMKLGVNMLLHGLNHSLAEALTLVSDAGIATETAYEVIENSAAAAPFISYRKGLYLDEEAHDVSFTVALARKDVGLALDLARSLGITLPQADLNEAMLTAACEAGYDARDMASVLSFVRKGFK